MGETLKWKSKLLSSSLPLEFEAAKILVSKGFSTRADLTYSRVDSGIVKDFSVDLHATGYIPFSNPNEIFASLELLIECKQRHPSVDWLFFPDPNRPDFSPITLGITLHAVDNFTYSFFQPNATLAFDKDIPFCYKGTEIDQSNGSVYDQELRHGIAQLQYALPRLCTENIMFSIRSHPNDNYPFLVCSILLTTADLFVANSKLQTSDVESASTIEEIAQEVPYLIFFSDYGPDFEAHCRKECEPLAKLPKMKSVQQIETYRKKTASMIINYHLP